MLERLLWIGAWACLRYVPSMRLRDTTQDELSPCAALFLASFTIIGRDAAS